MQDPPGVLDRRRRVERGEDGRRHSIRYASSNGLTFGPAATIMPSVRWSPLIQSASSSAVFACVSEYRRPLHEDVGRGIGVLALEDLLALVDRLDRLLPGLRVHEQDEPVHHLVAHPLVVAGVDGPIGLAPREVDRDALPVERIVVYAFVFDQFTACGSRTFPCSPNTSYVLRATLRIGPHCIGPNTMFEALNSRYPNFFSRWSMWTVASPTGTRDPR